MQNTRIMYFSLNPKRRKDFIENAKEEQYKNGFRVIDVEEENKMSIKHVSDLLFVLDNLIGEQRNVYVIIDYISMCKSWQLLEENSDYIRKAILKYPEVIFLFDETGKNDVKYDFKLFLFGGVSYKYIYDDFHKYNASEGETYKFKAITYGFGRI